MDGTLGYEFISPVFRLIRQDDGAAAGSNAAVAGTGEWQHSGTPTYGQSEVIGKLQVRRDCGRYSL